MFSFKSILLLFTKLINLNCSIHRFSEAKVRALDISKAFDGVWLEALVSKLLAFGVGGHFSRFISSFLKHRTVRMVIDGVFSEEFRLSSGVPQSSVLSPTVFLTFLNELLCNTSNPLYSFADDNSICIHIHLIEIVMV